MDNEILNTSPSSIENVDEAMFNWLLGLRLQTETNQGFKPAPIYWVGSERSFQIKDDKERNDFKGALVFPAIVVSRGDIVKNPNNKGTVWANIPPYFDNKKGSITIGKKINQEKTANFENAESDRKYSDPNFPRKKYNKTVYQYMSIPIPVYVEMPYTITIRTDYQQQMNQLLAPFLTYSGGINYFTIESNGHRYECFMGESAGVGGISTTFNNDNNTKHLGEEERKYITEVKIKALGYLFGADVNQESPFIVYRENAVEVKIPRERVMTRDQLEREGFLRP